MSRDANAVPVSTFLIELLPFSQVVLLNGFVVRHHLKPLHPLARRFVIRGTIPAFSSAISIVVGGFVLAILLDVGGFVLTAVLDDVGFALRISKVSRGLVL